MENSVRSPYGALAVHFTGEKSESLSRVRLFVTPWSAASQASRSRGFFRQEYWSGLPCPPPGDLPNPGIESVSLMSSAGGFFTTRATQEGWFIKPHVIRILDLLKQLFP